MRIGIIDLGTNSVRFDVQQLLKDGTFRQLHREKIMVRLGQGVFLKGTLDRGAARRTLDAFEQFPRTARALKAGKIIAFGTSALREVADRDQFLARVEEKTGIRLRVISGKEEAALIALGVLSREKSRLLKGRFALVDIGGGSTEISICDGQKILQSTSFPIGTARIQQLFLKKSPPGPGQLEAAREYISNVLRDVMSSEKWPSVRRVIGSSGTIRAIEKISRRETGSGLIRSGWVDDLTERMGAMTRASLRQIPGMEEKRVDMFLSGTLLFDECLKALGAREAVATEYSLRDGILEEELRLYGDGQSSHLSLHVEDLYERAARFGMERGHARHVADLAGSLFDALRPVHKLSQSWRIYLVAAAVLRDVGDSVNVFEHALHSGYIVRHSDLPGMEDWEIGFVAGLCSHHEDLKFDDRSGNFLKNPERKAAFRKLIALLCMLDEMDSGPETVIRVRGISRSRGEVFVRYSGKGLTGLEPVNVERRASIYRKALGIALHAVRP